MTKALKIVLFILIFLGTNFCLSIACSSIRESMGDGALSLSVAVAEGLVTSFFILGLYILLFGKDPKEWRCFYCDAVFYNEKDAEEHFGKEPTGEL